MASLEPREVEVSFAAFFVFDVLALVGLAPSFIEFLSGLVLGRSSEADLVPSSGPLETCLDFSASIKLCFLGLEIVEGCNGELMELVVDEGKLAVCSDSFCFFFLADVGSDAELGADGCVVSAADARDILLLFFDRGIVSFDNVCVESAVGLDTFAVS